ncbi:CHAT domain-containing protein [Desulfobacter curvatus]|uniref:CHAT domain-containing protein n=1 Tax=Desulfobacter curvatus TaxID=2290 RepID=UPI00037CF879|nr:CHAT domain-containing protein [Desulfobacter curvatus]
MHRGVSYVWAVTQDDYTVISIPFGGIEIRQLVSKLREELINRNESYKENAFKLYTLLVAPVERWIQNKRNLLIVPDDSLHMLPFQVLLTDPDQSCSQSVLPYLVFKHAIAYAPSAAIFENLDATRPMENSKRRSLIAFAPGEFKSENENWQRLSALPASIDEVRNIEAFFKPGQAVVKIYNEATKRAVLSERLSDFRFVHFATHAHFDDADPNGPGIVFYGGDDSEVLLQTAELAELELDADLIVLSACNTAMGKLTAGEGMLGLVRASFCAGARTVCASSWEVEDTATSILMANLYDNLVVKGLTKAEALRTSQLQLICKEQWSSPWFWGAFVMVGGWK